MNVVFSLTVIKLGLGKYRIIPSRMGTHSFRAGVVMALNFLGADQDDIKKMGRWSSDTFLVYIHDQIAEYSESWTNKIATLRSCFNLEGTFTYHQTGNKRGIVTQLVGPNIIRLDIGRLLTSVAV